MNLPNCPLDLNAPDATWQGWLRSSAVKDKDLCELKVRLNQYLLKTADPLNIRRLLGLVREQMANRFDSVVTDRDALLKEVLMRKREGQFA